LLGHQKCSLCLNKNVAVGQIFFANHDIYVSVTTSLLVSTSVVC